MPIRPEFLPLYRTPEWRAARRRVFERAGGGFDENGKYLGGARCERCRVPDRLTVYRAAGWWYSEEEKSWVAPNGKPNGLALDRFPQSIQRAVRIILACAHLNHTPGDDREENLACLCQWHHLGHDEEFHRRTRCIRKDAARPLLQAAVGVPA